MLAKKVIKWKASFAIYLNKYAKENFEVQERGPPVVPHILSNGKTL